jgi:hypothetical protein
MAQFKPGQQVVQTSPTVLVEVSDAAPLPVGSNRFQLVVVDNDGNPSAPAILEVIVQAAKIPTAVLEVVDANGGHLDPTVEAGHTFTLSAAKSSDVAPGKVVEYRFTLLPRT